MFYSSRGRKSPLTNLLLYYSDVNKMIESIRRKFGNRLLILGHHYQTDEVIQHTDLRGDSFQLSAAAAERGDCESIVFCGVHFMAETADILANTPEKIAARNGKYVNVILPDLTAGCSMADMADISQVESCWNELSEVINTSTVVPITYVNSTAEIKAFCGRNGGIACTSSNARAVLDWAFKQVGKEGGRIIFFPDQHLGRNTAHEMGISEDEIIVWRPDQPHGSLGGNSLEKIAKSRVILWDGYCSIHQKFTTAQIEKVRRDFPGIKVIVHPECCREVVEMADFAGSTSGILAAIKESPAGSKWAVATEWRMVERLIRMFPDKFICNLSPEPSICETMSRITPQNLLSALESIVIGKPKNVIRVPAEIAADAHTCLDRMLACK
ncbi:MAG: quinolinate synthase NadA [Thermoguttaceae bacterium]